jgi:hypothetical protein
MLEQLYDQPAEVLPLARYRQDFRDHFWKIDVSWKLERQPTFREPANESWSEMVNGNWARSMELVEELRAPRIKHQAELDEHGITQRRVRFVTDPVTPYLQWELTALKIWAELGEQITVLPEARVRHLETERLLPEVLVLGDESFPDPVMYEILYDDGVLAGGRKFTDPELIGACRAEIVTLWREGEPLETYFAREVADLPPPAVHGTG